MRETSSHLFASWARMRVIILLTAISAAVTLGSCTNEDDPYYSPLVGGWQLVDYAGPCSYYLSGMMLYGDGSGYVSGEDDYGFPQTWSIQWSSYSGNSLTIYFNDAYGTVWTYYYNFTGGELHMQPANDLSTQYWFARA
ncbi:MAG: hypothetical protein K2O12_04600 [Muribaculaceae bacterium]|nr:hypothetical protein [Muribaculaceae bacterium]